MSQKISQNTINYIIDFLVRAPVSHMEIIHYGSIDTAPKQTKIIILPSNFFSEEIFSTIKSLPIKPFKTFHDIPVLFGEPEIIYNENGSITLYIDLIAASFYMLSRYEETIKSECRDMHGRFLAKDSIIYQEGYGFRPIVDEYGKLLRNLLHQIGYFLPEEKHEFSTIYLTHDVDAPFMFQRFAVAVKQFIKNAIHWKNNQFYSANPFKKYLNEKIDEYNTFDKIVAYDTFLQKYYNVCPIIPIYFLISAGTFCNRKYYNFKSKKIIRLINYLQKTGAFLGLHISYEAAVNNQLLKNEVKKIKKYIINDKNLLSRYHYLRWMEPADITKMTTSGITDDFSLSYADCAGFRVGTCHPYNFINPLSGEICALIVHPLEIMDVSLTDNNYMNLDYAAALETCKKIINQVHKHSGELILLWHNTEFLQGNVNGSLYSEVINYIATF